MSALFWACLALALSWLAGALATCALTDRIETIRDWRPNAALSVLNLCGAVTTLLLALSR